MIFSLFFVIFLVSAQFVAGSEANVSRQRHAPLYGRLVAEEHLSAAHRDAVHQVSYFQSFTTYYEVNFQVNFAYVCAKHPIHQTKYH